jgi:signal transduction histidine kinase
MNIIEKITGPVDSLPIEHRFLNGISAVTAVLAVFILVNNILLGFPAMLNLIIGTGCIFFMSMYYLSRFRRRYRFPLLGLIIFFILCLPPAWFLNGGMLGSTLIICFFIFILIVIISKGMIRRVSLTIFCSEILAVIIIEYLNPEFVVTYKSRSMHFTDIVTSLIFAFIMIGVMVWLVMKNYAEEKRKADESNTLKSYFLANISHEIRTPMNSIMGFSELMKDPSLPDYDRMRYLDVIIGNGRHLLALINDIIDISRIEAGEVSIYLKPCPLRLLMNELYNIYSIQLGSTNGKISLMKEIPPGDDPDTVLVDELRLRQIMMNLLSNAVKFTDTGTISFGYTHAGAGIVRFHVKDTGAGISAANSTRVFEQFKQGDDSHTREHGGAGLGLAITKRLVGLMGGEIRLQSEEGLGSVFSFEIPCEKSAAGHPAYPSRYMNQTAGGTDSWKGKTVLIAEDNDDSFRLLEKILTRFSINVIRASTGLAAVEICRDETSLDCVLMDIQLPVMNGHEAVKKIREFNKNLPIIAQSGNAFESDRMMSLDAGCNEFIAKPIIMDNLLEVLGRYL